MGSNGSTPDKIREHILVIEDSPTQAEQLRYILEKHHYRVSVACNGGAALAKIAEQKPALIISDIVMPEMDGYELCRHIKTREDSRNVPVILLTSLNNPKDVIRALECGADNFFTKPYREEYLLSRIMDILASRHHDQETQNLPGLEISFGCQKHLITSNRRQILDLLLSTYEAAILKNNELISARDELSALNEQLSAANQELAAFNYTVSHDLCQPLNYIGVACQAIKMSSYDKLDDNNKECLDIVMDGVNHMAKLIESLLRFSNSTQKAMHPEIVSLSTIANKIASKLRTAEPGRQVIFTSAEELTAHGDPQLLYVVLDNLLGNAWKYTGKQEHAVIEFGSVEHNGTTVFFVRDNGPGFSMTDVENLFIPFKRLPGTTEFLGHGIGLATVERIIRRHNGKIWAEAEPCKGATFFFTLGK